MSDDQSINPEDANVPAAEPGKTDDASRSVENLKAKLGLKTKKAEEAIAADAARPKAPSASDFGLGLSERVAPEARAPAAASSVRMPAVDMGEPVQAKAIERKHVVAIAAIVALMTILGIFFGGVLKGRALENSKTREAKHLIEYFTETPLAQTGKAPTTIMNAVQAHVGELARVIDTLGRAGESKDVRVRLDAEKEMSAFLKRAQEYRDRKPFFVLDQVYPGVVFNGELASQVVGFVENVKNLYDESVLLALEADTLERVGETEEKGVGANHVIMIPAAVGDAARKAVWIQAVDKENPRQGTGGVEYAVLPVGAEKGMVVAASSLAEIDISPIAKEKSLVYRAAIFDRVRARLGQMKMVSDQIDFDSLKEKLQKYSSRGSYITLF
jgi:hypothetical protein